MSWETFRTIRKRNGYRVSSLKDVQGGITRGVGNMAHDVESKLAANEERKAINKNNLRHQCTMSYIK